jgi:phage shock protein A
VIHEKERPVIVNREQLIVRDPADKDTIQQQQYTLIQQQKRIHEMQTRLASLKSEKDALKRKKLTERDVSKAVTKLRKKGDNVSLYDLLKYLNRKL